MGRFFSYFLGGSVGLCGSRPGVPETGIYDIRMEIHRSLVETPARFRHLNKYFFESMHWRSKMRINNHHLDDIWLLGG